MRTLAGALLLLVACNGDPTAGKPQPSATVSVAPKHALSASTTADVAASPHAGTWRASFLAEKTDVDVPKKARWQWWEKEGGEAATGKGELVLDVAADGRVSGRATGALGDMDASGTFADGSLRVALSPSDPDAETAMTGWVVGTLTKGAVEGELRVSDHSGNVVRKAPINLTKKP